MSLSEAFNQDGHGHIHPLLGGSWPPEAEAYAGRTNANVEPFAQEVTVSLPTRADPRCG